MTSVMVKICGIMDTATLEQMMAQPIDQIGFVFAKSRRQVSASLAGELISRIKNNPERSGPAMKGYPMPLAAGVFVNPTEDELRSIIQEAPLDIVQLHGNETPELCRWVKETFGVQVFKTVSVSNDGKELTPQESIAPYRDSADAVLLDTYDPTIGGGTGRPFVWDCIPAFREEAHRNGLKLIVAGGLTPDNVYRLIRDYAPDGVDVSSGVETDGHKDIAKIEAFVGRVKE